MKLQVAMALLATALLTAAKMPASDNEFMTMAAQGGLAEVMLGKLAEERGMSADVKAFGKRMVADHGKANSELLALAKQKNVHLPADLNAKQKATYAKLKGLSGAAFDRAYVLEMVKDHEHDVAMFRQENKQTKDGELKAWTGKTLPTLAHHLGMIKELQRKMK